MSKYNDTLLTTVGQALATRAANGSAKFSITRAVGSKTDLSGKTDAELVALTSLPDETQVAQIVAEVDDPDGSTGITGTQVTFQNKNEDASIDEGYQLNTIGLFAKEEGSDKEILYALTTADEADYIPDFADNVFYKFTITIYVVVGQKAAVTVAIDVTGTASIDYVNNTIAKAMENLPKDIARTGADNKFTGTNDFQKATVKGVNVATTADINAKQDKIGYTPADDSKVIHSTVTQLNSTDMNTVTTAGFYRLSSGTNGMPNVDAWTIYQVIPLSGYNGVQLAYGTNNAILGMRSWNGSNNFTSWVQFADDSTVPHLSGANNFDTVPTVNNNPLLLQADLSSYITKDQLTAILKDYIKVDPNTGYVDHTIKVHYGNLLIDSDVVGVNKWVLDEDTAIAQTAIYPANNYYVSDDTTTGGAS